MYKDFPLTRHSQFLFVVSRRDFELSLRFFTSLYFIIIIVIGRANQRLFVYRYTMLQSAKPTFSPFYRVPPSCITLICFYSRCCYYTTLVTNYFTTTPYNCIALKRERAVFRGRYIFYYKLLGPRRVVFCRVLVTTKCTHNITHSALFVFEILRFECFEQKSKTEVNINVNLNRLVRIKSQNFFKISFYNVVYTAFTIIIFITNYLLNDC